LKLAFIPVKPSKFRRSKGYSQKRKVVKDSAMPSLF
jgi:hypothetical protein